MELIEVEKGSEKHNGTIKIHKCGKQYKLYIPQNLMFEENYKYVKILIDNPEKISYMEIHFFKEPVKNSFKIVKHKSGCRITVRKIFNNLVDQGKTIPKHVQKENNVIKIWW